MSAHALIDLTCPHCLSHVSETAKLVRPGGQAYCPECERLFALDERNEQQRRALVEAKEARRRRKDRLAELRERWADPAPARPVVSKPVLISDVLKTLDALLAKLDAGIEPTAQPPSAKG